MKKKFIMQSNNGYKIYMEENSIHMLAHSDVSLNLIKDAIGMFTYTAPFTMSSVDMLGVCGTTSCVVTTDADHVEMCLRKGHNRLTRTVFNREPEPTRFVTLGICDDDDGLATIFTAFCGELAPKELSDPRLTEAERPEAEAFWANHAIVYSEENFE